MSGFPLSLSSIITLSDSAYPVCPVRYYWSACLSLSLFSLSLCLSLSLSPFNPLPPPFLSTHDPSSTLSPSLPVVTIELALSELMVSSSPPPLQSLGLLSSLRPNQPHSPSPLPSDSFGASDELTAMIDPEASDDSSLLSQQRLTSSPLVHNDDLSPPSSTFLTSILATPTPQIQSYTPSNPIWHDIGRSQGGAMSPNFDMPIGSASGSDNSNSTGKGILIGVLSAFGSAGIAVLVLAIFFFFRYTNRGRIILDRIGRPGEYDDEQAFAREEAEALETMDELTRQEYLRAKGTAIGRDD